VTFPRLPVSAHHSEDILAARMLTIDTSQVSDESKGLIALGVTLGIAIILLVAGIEDELEDRLIE
jgi:hypothetical protein